MDFMDPSYELDGYLPTRDEMWFAKPDELSWGARYIEETDSSDQSSTYYQSPLTTDLSLLTTHQSFQEVDELVPQNYSLTPGRTDLPNMNSSTPSASLNDTSRTQFMLDCHSSKDGPSKRSSISRKGPARCGPLTEAASKKQQKVRALKSCWRCKILKKSCDCATPCKQCTNTRLKATVWHLGCRREPLTCLSLELAPVTLGYSGLSDLTAGAVTPWPQSAQALLSIATRGLQFYASDPTDHIKCEGAQLARDLLDGATHYTTNLSVEYPIIVHALEYFNTVTDIYRLFEAKHRQRIQLSTTQVPINNTYKLQALARTKLETILGELQTYLFARKKEHWLRSFYSLCIILLTAEVTQMNTCLDDLLSGHRGTQWIAISKAMEKFGTDVLIQLFKTSFRGFDPLSVESNMRGHTRLLQADDPTFQAYEHLQRIIASYKDYWKLHSIGPHVEEGCGIKPRITGRFISLLVS